jgi:hypothetical protein
VQKRLDVFMWDFDLRGTTRYRQSRDLHRKSPQGGQARGPSVVQSSKFELVITPDCPDAGPGRASLAARSRQNPFCVQKLPPPETDAIHCWKE